MLVRAARFQFERSVNEYAEWRAVPEHERSPAPAWWWSPALSVKKEQAAMPDDWCRSLALAQGSSFDAGAQVFINSIADQTSLPWPDEFPRKFERDDQKFHLKD
jgi:hypothetical protein